MHLCFLSYTDVLSRRPSACGSAVVRGRQGWHDGYWVQILPTTHSIRLRRRFARPLRCLVRFQPSLTFLFFHWTIIRGGIRSSFRSISLSLRSSLRYVVATGCVLVGAWFTHSWLSLRGLCMVSNSCCPLRHIRGSTQRARAPCSPPPTNTILWRER